MSANFDDAFAEIEAEAHAAGPTAECDLRKKQARYRRIRFHKHRAEAVVDGFGKRHCAYCGDFIDPKDWCPWCVQGKRCPTHRRPGLRQDAAFCNSGCRQAERSTFVRDVVTRH